MINLSNGRLVVWRNYLRVRFKCGWNRIPNESDISRQVNELLGTEDIQSGIVVLDYHPDDSEFRIWSICGVTKNGDPYYATLPSGCNRTALEVKIVRYNAIKNISWYFNEGLKCKPLLRFSRDKRGCVSVWLAMNTTKLTDESYRRIATELLPQCKVAVRSWFDVYKLRHMLDS